MVAGSTPPLSAQWIMHRPSRNRRATSARRSRIASMRCGGPQWRTCHRVCRRKQGGHTSPSPAGGAAEFKATTTSLRSGMRPLTTPISPECASAAVRAQSQPHTGAARRPEQHRAEARQVLGDADPRAPVSTARTCRGPDPHHVRADTYAETWNQPPSRGGCRCLERAVRPM